MKKRSLFSFALSTLLLVFSVITVYAVPNPSGSNEAILSEYHMIDARSVEAPVSRSHFTGTTTVGNALEMTVCIPHCILLESLGDVSMVIKGNLLTITLDNGHLVQRICRGNIGVQLHSTEDGRLLYEGYIPKIQCRDGVYPTSGGSGGAVIPT